MRPTKLVKGQILSRLLAESNCKALGVNFMSINSENQQAEIADKKSIITPSLVGCTWYKDIIYFLQTLRPLDGLDMNKVRYLKLKEIKYCLIDHVLYWKDPLGVMLRCLDPHEDQGAITYFHDILCGDHHFWRSTDYKIPEFDIFGPTILLMFVQILELVSNSKIFLERSGSNICL
jgi:hypothetical protein